MSNLNSMFKNVFTPSKWNLLSSEPLTAEDKETLKEIRINRSKPNPQAGLEGGLYVAFYLKSGGIAPMTLSINSREVVEGEVINPDDVVMETLGREGEDNIYRVNIK